MMPKKITLEDYLFSKGVGSPVSGYMIDKLKIPHGQTRRQRDKMMKEAERAENEYQAKRQAMTDEYNQKVANGEIVELTPLERRIRKAKGHPDNAAVQAARRLLEKQGIDWRNCP